MKIQKYNNRTDIASNPINDLTTLIFSPRDFFLDNIAHLRYAFKESAKTYLEFREVNSPPLVSALISAIDSIGAFIEHKYQNKNLNKF